MFDMENEVARVHAAVLREEMGDLLAAATALDGKQREKALVRAAHLRQRIDQLDATNWPTYRPHSGAIAAVGHGFRNAWEAMFDAPLRIGHPLPRRAGLSR